MDGSLPDFSVHGIFSGKNTGVDCYFPPSGDLPDPEIEPISLTPPALAGGFFTTSATWEAQKSLLNLLQYCLCIMFGFLITRLVGSQLPDQGLNPHRLNRKVKS